jgi:hypothetical protein
MVVELDCGTAALLMYLRWDGHDDGGDGGDHVCNHLC